MSIPAELVIAQHLLVPDRIEETDMPMSSQDRTEHARARLAELRRAALRRATNLSSGFDAIVEAANDVATDDEHDPEGHTIAWERQQLASLLAEARTTLASVDLAEQRLAEGRYGICTICDQAIAAERLEVLPVTETCVDCARK